MIRQVEVTVSPQTTPQNPSESVIRLAPGTITRIYARSAPGCNNEVYFRFLFHENSFVPDDNDQWIPMPGTVQEFNPQFVDFDGTYDIILQVCSPEARFIHIVNFEIELYERPTIEELIDDMIARGF